MPWASERENGECRHEWPSGQVLWSLSHYFFLHFCIHLSLLPPSESSRYHVIRGNSTFLYPYLCLPFLLVKTQHFHNDAMQRRHVPASPGTCIGCCRARVFDTLKTHTNLIHVQTATTLPDGFWVTRVTRKALHSHLAE